MATIPNGSSKYAPSLALNGNDLVLCYVSDGNLGLQNSGLYLSIYDINTLNFSNPILLGNHESSFRPAISFWNGNYYFIHRAADSDNNTYFGMTDLVSFPSKNDQVPQTPYQTDFIPNLFPFGSTLIATSAVESDIQSQQTFSFLGDANWVMDGALSPWGNGLQIHLNDSLADGSHRIALVNGGQTVNIVVYRDSNKIVHSLSSLAPDFSGGTTAQVSTNLSNSYTMATVWDDQVYCVWVGDETDPPILYSVGTPASDGSLSWSAPTAVPGAQAGTTDVTICSGTSGIFIGYAANQIGFLKLSI